MPGAGKTILTSVVIDHLTQRFLNDPAVGIAYVYCNFQRQNEQNIDHLLSSILRQLAETQPAMLDSVKSLYDRHRIKETRPLLTEILTSLCAVAATYSRLFVIVDALDECQVLDGCQAQLFSSLFALQEKQGANIFATSRFIPQILDHFKTSISLEIRATTADVTRYLKGHMNQLPSCVRQDPQLQEEIRIGISEGADGM